VMLDLSHKYEKLKKAALKLKIPIGSL
jgi:hypothetical protein